ncbi:MAG TPA: tetratricopeptide repeat protein, partial [Holophaga sp.]|nr:tetratricopeptide repeat protein [Holophaga sp.]
MFHARAKQQQAGGDDPRGAVLLYQKVIALEPKSSEAYLRLSEALVEANDPEAAVAPATKATELNPGSGEAWANLGMIQNVRGQSKPAAKEQARAAYQEAVKLLPNDPDVWLKLARLNQSLGDTEGALKVWLALGRMHPGGYLADKPLEVVAWEQATILATNLNQYEARREAIMALCGMDHPASQHLRLLEELAKEQADKGFLGHAEDSFLVLGNQFPLEPAIWENIARIQLQTARFEAALDSYRKADALRPSSRLSYFQGLCLMNLGRLQEADKLWQAFFAPGAPPPDDEEMRHNARFLHAACVLLEGRPGDVLSMLKAWPESDQEAELMVLKTQATIQTKAWKNALGLLEDGLNRFPEQALFKATRTMPQDIFKDKQNPKKNAIQALMQLDYENTAELWSEFQQWGKCLELVRLAREAFPARRANLFMMQSSA